MSGAVPWLARREMHARGTTPRGIPMRVAVSVWVAAFALVGGSLVLLGVEGRVQAEGAPGLPTVPTLTATHVARTTLPDGRDEAGTLTISGDRIRAALPVRHEASLYGWGTVRLAADPLEDEVFVRTIVDAPTERRRWSAQCDVVLHVDEREVRVRAESVGTRMKSGVFYDALRFELGIDTVRALARAREVSGSVCGDPLVLSPAQRATLERFVEGFDAMALPPAVPPIETEIEIMPTDPDEVLDDADTYLEPA
ncbi:MAG: hypothetical protein K1X94_27420 [Sandaracinaceae bacterium]|nr:hypothetical protein [Sandaracinaceae bacterium]